MFSFYPCPLAFQLLLTFDPRLLSHHNPAQELYPATQTPRTMAEKPKCVLAYSGGLDTSVILVWLIEKVRRVVWFGVEGLCLSSF